MKLIERLAPLKKYSIVISFLALEVFAFIAFSFGNSFVLFGVLSFALMVLLIYVTIRDINVNGIAHIAILFIPFVLCFNFSTILHFILNKIYFVQV